MATWRRTQEVQRTSSVGEVSRAVAGELPAIFLRPMKWNRTQRQCSNRRAAPKCIFFSSLLNVPHQIPPALCAFGLMHVLTLLDISATAEHNAAASSAGASEHRQVIPGKVAPWLSLADAPNESHQAKCRCFRARAVDQRSTEHVRLSVA